MGAGSPAAPAPAPAPLAVVILAAGAGTRMRSDAPKVLQRLAGRPLLKHVIDTVRQLHPAAIHVVYGHGGDAVRAALAAERVHWVEQAERLGTGHAVMQVLPHLQADRQVLILYGDVPLITAATLRALVAAGGPRRVALLTALLADPRGYGRVIRERGRVRRIVEERDATVRQRAVRECNTGVMVLPAGRLGAWLRGVSNRNSQGEYYLTDVIAAAVRDGAAVRPLVVPDETEVLGVNDRVQLAAAEAAWRRRQATALLHAGVTLADPERIDVRGTVVAGRDVYIDVNAVLEGEVRLGDGAHIGPNCLIRDSDLGAGTQVLANSVIERAVTGPSCRIGPFARLRPDARLDAGVHVGNFVEVKNSTLGAGSKANHLAYLGDAVVGAGVNIGAGTVTCNYDGANKSMTQIGDNVFVGSGSMLVAPVTIGAGATIGAGSTITRDAPAGQLTLARARQVSVPGWERPKKKSRA